MARFHPVFTAHTAELEKLLYLNAGHLQKYRESGDTDNDDYRYLDRIQRRCTDLLMRMIAEDDHIMLVNDDDYDWIRKACAFIHHYLGEDTRRAI